MKIRLSELRRLVRSVLVEQTWMPGRYYPALEPVDQRDQERLGSQLGEEDELDDLDEVDTDPSNNPGRPEDAFDYLGMHPKPEAAMAHPFAGGGGTGGAGGQSGTGGPAEPPDEPSDDL